jgi:GTP-binding protein
MKNIRNIAIIAHIDHGKTTLLDCLLKQARLFRDNQVIAERMMDSYDQEKERGITIFSKNTSLPYKDGKINVIDTPGHADFSGEVERVLGMVNSVLLLVDAQDGPMPQTRYVLSKALKMGLKPIVVINKIDRPNATPDKVLDQTFDLFVELGANDEQLNFRYCYSSAINGFAVLHLDEPRVDMTPLFDLILEAVPAPEGDVEKPFLMQAMSLGYDDYVGRQATGRILNGKVKKGDRVRRASPDGKESLHTITRVEGYSGLTKVEMQEAATGDIIILSGIDEIQLGDTITSSQSTITLPGVTIDPPTLSIEMMINSGPFAGRDGKNITFNKIKERLLKEKRSNISLLIEEDPSNRDSMSVSGRGELHLSVLLEAMRREGFEMTISKPKVITKKQGDVLHEPIEKVYVQVPEEYSGKVIEQLAIRKGEMQHLCVNEHAIAEMEFLIPTRGLMGYRNDFLTTTRGLGILSSLFDSYQAYKGEISGRATGALISMNAGKSTTYAIEQLQDRGVLYISPGDEVYEGMIVGEHNRDNDLIVNITKTKQLTNFRAAGSEDLAMITPAKKVLLERAIGTIEDDELIEITPNCIRLRKKHLREVDRKRG